MFAVAKIETFILQVSIVIEIVKNREISDDNVSLIRQDLQGRIWRGESQDIVTFLPQSLTFCHLVIFLVGVNINTL